MLNSSKNKHSVPPSPYTDLQTALPFPTGVQTQSWESRGVGDPSPSLHPCPSQTTTFLPFLSRQPRCFSIPAGFCQGPYSGGLGTHSLPAEWCRASTITLAGGCRIRPWFLKSPETRNSLETPSATSPH